MILFQVAIKQVVGKIQTIATLEEAQGERLLAKGNDIVSPVHPWAR